MNILIDSNDVNRTAFGENAAPKYRTNRHRGALPGLAEFQQQILAEKEVEIFEIAWFFGFYIQCLDMTGYA